MVTLPTSKTLGAFYTPCQLAEWVADEILAGASSANTFVRNVVDPACGDGALLRAMHRLAGTSLSLTGIDINPVAAAQCAAALGPASNILVGDALDPECRWGEVPPDAVIVNPPWGSELSKSRKFYRDNGYRLASGQFDICDLFVERALGITKPGAILGFILPDSVFQPDHRTLRELLLEHTLLLIARLGEGVFDGIYRSTVVIVLRQGKPRGDHLVECLQVPAIQRKLLSQEMVSFKDVKDLYSHRIPQSRFLENTQSKFNIAQDVTGYRVFQQFSSLPSFSWERRVRLGRGIEIGKRGLTVRCKACGTFRPLPMGSSPVRCSLCSTLIPENAPQQAIIDCSTRPGWTPLIVGEDVDRYSATPSRFINTSVPGIKYKPMKHFTARKLLIRKTGVGLRAAIDESGAATIQTVFYVVASSQKHEWLLDYLQGVINSRPLLAWYLRWSGENQWRSHPYITSRVLRELPIPDPYYDYQIGRLARRIGEESRLVRAGITDSDLVVDTMVCQLYGLDRGGVSWVSEVLSDTEDQLKYFRRMRISLVDMPINKLRVETGVP